MKTFWPLLLDLALSLLFCIGSPQQAPDASVTRWEWRRPENRTTHWDLYRNGVYVGYTNGEHFYNRRQMIEDCPCRLPDRP